MKILITQYVRPHGRERECSFELPDEFKPQMELIQECGCKITCEQLQTLEAVSYVTHEEGDFDIIISACGKEANKALEKMIRRFDKTKFDEWLASMKEDTENPDAR